KQRFSRRWCWYRGSSRARGRPDGGCPEVTRLGIGLLGAVLGALAVWLVIGRSGAGPSGEPTHGEPDDSTPVEVQRGPEGVTIRLDATTRERIGLQVTPLAAVDRPAVVRGFGRLLEPSALAAPVDEREAARSAFDAADREYRRVQTLQRGNYNASQRDLEAARATFERDRATFRAAEARLVSVWGGEAREHRDLSLLVQSLVAREAAVARIDLPLGTALSGRPTTARVAALVDADAAPVEATILGAAPDTDPTTQGRGFLLLVERPPWPPGTALTGWLAVPGSSQAGVDVPSAAVLRHAGRGFVYGPTAHRTLLRPAGRLDRPTGDGWFVAGGVAAGERVVVTGAQQLLSAELAGSTGLAGSTELPGSTAAED